MYVEKGGELYGFCPAKAAWDKRNLDAYNELVLISELKTLPRPGGLNNQDSDLIDALSWFLPQYDFMKFRRKADMILGGDSKKTDKGSTDGNLRRIPGKGKRR